MSDEEELKRIESLYANQPFGETVVEIQDDLAELGLRNDEL